MQRRSVLEDEHLSRLAEEERRRSVAEIEVTRTDLARRRAERDYATARAALEAHREADARSAVAGSEPSLAASGRSDSAPEPSRGASDRREVA